MPSRSETIAELRSLADALFDGVIGKEGMERLEELILGDATCLQAYLEMVNLQGDLISKADLQSDDQAALTTLREFTMQCKRRESRRYLRDLALTTASILLVGGFIGWFFLAESFRPTPLGNIAQMTSDASTHSGKMELGQVLRQGGTVSIAEGIVSLQLKDVVLDLHGPTQLKLNDFNRVQLQAGTVTVRVSPGGEGFTVRTPDAEVVDLGTEFLVQYDSRDGTEVAVRRGHATARLLDSQGLPTKILDLTTSRAAKLNLQTAVLEETAYTPEKFERVDRAFGTIHSTSGQLRTLSDAPSSLASKSVLTPNRLLVVPERQKLTLNEELEVETMTGRVVLPAGSIVSSYLVHYDPTHAASNAPRGTVTIDGRIAATLASSSSLNATDAIFGLPKTLYETRPFRGLELDADEVQISDDNQTISFFFGMAPPEFLDEVRFLVVAE